jgi:hypothetical protein
MMFVPIWNEMADASVLLGLTRIHQPCLVTRMRAGEAPALATVARRATAITEPIHCFLVFIVFGFVFSDFKRVVLRVVKP